MRVCSDVIGVERAPSGACGAGKTAEAADGVDAGGSEGSGVRDEVLGTNYYKEITKIYDLLESEETIEPKQERR